MSHTCNVAGGSLPFLTPIGGDTQLIYNIEYRVPIISVLSVAAFADVGTVFNLRKYNDQITSSNFVNSPVVPQRCDHSGWRRDNQSGRRLGDADADR